jgi:hypothetical protein
MAVQVSSGDAPYVVAASDYDVLAAEMAARQEREQDTRLELATSYRRIAQLEAHLRRADDIEHSISAEDWYRQRDALLALQSETPAKPHMESQDDD